ncbi:hypothetical protein IE53DRAFT_178337 [Violaceomyces palustris]|uniref:Uncharacterized protein n=1 Tax=Violaceomyces palustris TaxID=1673888 RepID=A0ACD0NSK4_9BASI|nr:hypothetical protein IE53DRAFT_178337 [Violaceomyces palustris]
MKMGTKRKGRRACPPPLLPLINIGHLNFVRRRRRNTQTTTTSSKSFERIQRKGGRKMKFAFGIFLLATSLVPLTVSAIPVLEGGGGLQDGSTDLSEQKIAEFEKQVESKKVSTETDREFYGAYCGGSNHCVFVEGDYAYVTNFQYTDGRGTFVFPENAQTRVVPRQGSPIDVDFGYYSSRASFESYPFGREDAYFSSRPGQEMRRSRGPIYSNEIGDDLHILL